VPPGVPAASASRPVKATMRATVGGGMRGYSAAVMCTRSVASMGSTCTRVNRLRNDLGRPCFEGRRIIAV